MVGVRRRLREVGSKVSEALGAKAPAAGPPPGPTVLPRPAAVPVPPADRSDAITETTPTTETTVGPEPDQSPDAVLAAAVELARAVAVEVGGQAVGDHLGAEVAGPADEGPAVTHSFATTDRAYVGWRWAVTLARADGSDDVTVDEVVLLPGAGSLLAPAWVPWSERVRPDDLGHGDLLPSGLDDPRLVPAYAAGDDDETELADLLWLELGLGRVHVLSHEGRAETAERWWDGETGPDSARAKAAPGTCGECGFLVPLGGALRQAFGACANEYAPDDGSVVALSYGCGAFSETSVDGAHAATAGMAVEDDEFELVASGGDPVDPVEDEPGPDAP